MAINGNQWQSMTINGNQWQSMAINGNYWYSIAINGIQWQLMAVNGTQPFPESTSQKARLTDCDTETRTKSFSASRTTRQCCNEDQKWTEDEDEESSEF